jgi:nitrogen regulatory protein PII
VTLALERLAGFGGITVSDCRGFGQDKIRDARESSGPGTTDRGSVGIVDFTPKVKIEVAVAGRDRADAVVETIARSAHTGRRGDGKVFAWPLSHAVRVRTQETGRGAIAAPGETTAGGGHGTR